MAQYIRYINKKIAVAGCKHTTRDLIVGLKRNGILVQNCITIRPKKAKEQKVAGYMDLRKFLDSENISYTIANKYNLRNDEDIKNIISLNIDILLVMGWQRLIPDWFLENLKIGAFGMHGSSRPLPYGRGRSPINWSLIQDKKIFYTHLFKYMPGVDNGPIVGVQTFDINCYDDCHSLHLKNTLSMIRLCIKYIPKLLKNEAILSPQMDEAASYYPKRTVEDGIIYWDDSTITIYNLIRAVTKPFPGAFSYLDNNPRQKITIWKAHPFDTKLIYRNVKPGEVVDVFYDGSFIIKTGDYSLFILESEGHNFTVKDIGKCLGHLKKPRKIWDNLPE